MKLKNDIKKYMTLGAALAGSAFLVSCDGDDVQVTEANPNTTVEPNKQDVAVPSASQLAGQVISQFIEANPGKAALPATYDIKAGDTFADADTLTISGALFDFTRVDTSDGFTLSDIKPQGGHAPATTQGTVDAAVTNAALGNFTFANITANDNNLINTASGQGSNVASIGHGASTGSTIRVALQLLSQNRKLKSDAGFFNGNTSVSVSGTNVTDPSGNVIPLSAFNGPAAVGQLTTTAGIAGTDFDPTQATFIGFKAIDSFIARPDVANTLELDVKNTISYLDGIISGIDAAEQGLLDAINDTANLAPFAAVSKYDITLSFDEQFANDTDILRKGNFSSVVTCTVPTTVTLTAATNGYRVGDTYLDATNTQNVSGTNNGAFTIQQVTP